MIKSLLAEESIVVFYRPFFCYRWYFRKIKRIEAEKKLLLPENDHGAFLIRDSESRHNDYSLSGKSDVVQIVLFIYLYLR